MKYICYLAVATAVLSAFGEEEPKDIRLGDKYVSRTEMRKLMNKVNLKRFGGHIRKANSAKGHFVLIDAQKTASSSAITNALSTINRTVKVQTKIVKEDAVTVDNIRQLIHKHGGVVGVAVIDVADKLPALLSATEEGWAIVNVGKLGADNPSQDVLSSRLRKEILRAFAFAAGGVYSSKGDPVMIPIRTPVDLDKIAHEDFAVAMRQTFSLVLPEQGLTPWLETTYLKACQEGWAPQPTNEYQKAIWEQIHAIPTKPIKIEFDPKTDTK